MNTRSSKFCTLVFLFVFLISLFSVTHTVHAGAIAPSASPAVGTYTLSDIFDRLVSNTAATSGNHDFAPTTTPRSTFPTLTSIYEAIPTIDPTKLLSGTSYMGVTGTIPVKTGNTSVASSSAQGTSIVLTVPQGYYSGSSGVTLSTTSDNFTVDNIKNGISLFGLVGTLLGAVGNAGTPDVFLGKTFSTSTATNQTGTLTLACATSQFDGSANKVTDSYDGSGNGNNRWCMTDTGDATAGNIATGTKAWVDGNEITGSFDPYTPQRLQTKDDWVNSGGITGEYTAEESVWVTVSGSPFNGYDAIDFTPDYGGGPADLYSGTVKQDTRTGLWWSDIYAVGGSASTTNNSFTLSADGSRPTGGNAIGFCNALNTANFAGHNDWYLPTQKQLQQAYIDGSANNIPSPGFNFWSSTEFSSNALTAGYVGLYYGSTSTNTKVNSNYVRCVRS